MQERMCVYLKRPVGWWMGPKKRRAAGAKYCWGWVVAEATAGTCRMFLEDDGCCANFTVIGSVAPSGMVPLSILMARSASWRWSKRMKPTPLEIPARGRQPCKTLPLEPVQSIACPEA